jgi:predicted dehydrogenase/sugar phosphate isomerase/epimerase
LKPFSDGSFIMSHTISFMSANFVAREIGYDMNAGWSQGDQATQAYFSPLGTYEERFGCLVREIRTLGFEVMDLWGAHLHFSWATPEHLSIAVRCIREHGMRVGSYAAWVLGGVPELRAACRVCQALNIPLIGGYVELLEKDRAAALKVLREFGVAYGFENHPERSADEILSKIGEGDEDVVGLTLDPGWLVTQGAPVLEALDRLAPRIKLVHLKDLKARRAEPTGYPFIDMGHETCCTGEGVVPLERLVRRLVMGGYRGAFSIEHEPEVGNPGPDCARALPVVRQWIDSASIEVLAGRAPHRVAIAGCGNIAATYGAQLAAHPGICFVGAFDLDGERSKAYCARFGGQAYPSLEALLQDDQVETLVNLTIHHAHPEVITRALEAGKHVHSEKPLAMTYPECKRLADLADEKGLRLSAAPVVFLGEAQQTLAKALRQGLIGTVRTVFAETNWGRIESWHPNPVPFYEVGPVFDVAVYPITTLTAWFGPVVKVLADAAVLLKDRRTLSGETFCPGSPDHTVSLLEFASGVRCRLTCNFYVGWHTRQKGFEIHGDLGSLALNSVYDFDAPVEHAPFGGEWQPVPFVRVPFRGCEYARGVTELADALWEGRDHRCTGRHAAHVVEVMEAILSSAREGKAVVLESTFPQPLPACWA